MKDQETVKKMEQRQPYSRHPEWFKLEMFKIYYDHGENRKLTLLEYEKDLSCLGDRLRKYASQKKHYLCTSKRVKI